MITQETEKHQKAFVEISKSKTRSVFLQWHQINRRVRACELMNTLLHSTPTSSCSTETQKPLTLTSLQTFHLPNTKEDILRIFFCTVKVIGVHCCLLPAFLRTSSSWWQNDYYQLNDPFNLYYCHSHNFTFLAKIKLVKHWKKHFCNF